MPNSDIYNNWPYLLSICRVFVLHNYVCICSTFTLLEHQLSMIFIQSNPFKVRVIMK